MENSARRPTIYDVAKEAGVSRATISKVLNDYPHVDENTRKKVLEVIGKMNYVPSVSARQLAKSKNIKTQESIRKEIVYFVLPEHLKEKPYDPFYSEVLFGAIDEAKKLNLKVVTDYVSQDYRKHLDIPSLIKDGLVAGAIITGTFARRTLNNDFIDDLLNINIPIVDFCENEVIDKKINSVTADRYQGIYDAVKYLIDMGHKKIGLIRTDLDTFSVRDKVKGYRSALESHGLEYNENFIEKGPFTHEGGYNAMKKILEKNTPLTAIVAIEDMLAIGAKSAIEDKGLKVPDDISITGYGDIQMASQIKPALTTVKIPVIEIGRLTIRRIYEIQDSGISEITKTKLAMKLIIRDSVRNIG